MTVSVKRLVEVNKKADTLWFCTHTFRNGLFTLPIQIPVLIPIQTATIQNFSYCKESNSDSHPYCEHRNGIGIGTGIGICFCEAIGVRDVNCCYLLHWHKFLFSHANISLVQNRIKLWTQLRVNDQVEWWYKYIHSTEVSQFAIISFTPRENLSIHCQCHSMSSSRVNSHLLYHVLTEWGDLFWYGYVSTADA